LVSRGIECRRSLMRCSQRCTQTTQILGRMVAGCTVCTPSVLPGANFWSYEHSSTANSEKGTRESRLAMNLEQVNPRDSGPRRGQTRRGLRLHVRCETPSEHRNFLFSCGLNLVTRYNNGSHSLGLVMPTRRCRLGI
jgi:hypothetical protein